MGYLYGVIAVFAVVNALLVPWILSKNYVISRPYYAVSITITLVLGILNVILISSGNISFIPMILYFFGPGASLFITDRIIEKKEEQTGPKAIDFSTLYDPRAVFAKTKQIQEGPCGFIRFRMDKVSYLTEDFKIPAPELVFLNYSRPLNSEAELLRLTNDFCDRYQDSHTGSDGRKAVEWQLADEIWHDREGAYRLLLVFQCDASGSYPRIYDPFYQDYIDKDADPYQNRGFHSV